MEKIEKKIRKRYRILKWTRRSGDIVFEVQKRMIFWFPYWWRDINNELYSWKEDAIGTLEIEINKDLTAYNKRMVDCEVFEYET